MKTYLKNSGSRRRGFGLVESILGGMIMVALTLFLIDLMAMIVVHVTQDRLTYNAARIAANCDQEGKAVAAADSVLKLAQQQKNLITSIKRLPVKYVANHRVEVALITEMRLPAPIPCIPDKISFRTDAIAPIVATPVARFETQAQ